MSEYREFTFAPAPLRGARTVRIYEDRIERWHKDDMEDSIAFGDITKARYVEDFVERYNMWCLYLGRESGGTFKLSLNKDQTDNARDSDDVRDYLGALINLCHRLTTARPDVTVSFGPVSAVKWFSFIFGILAMIFAIGAPIAAAAADLTETTAEIAMALLGMFAMGAAMVWTYNPWRNQAKLDWNELMAVVGEKVPEVCD